MFLAIPILLLAAAQPLPQAVELFRQGKLAEAETALRQLTQTTPADPAVWNLLGAVLDERHGYSEAETCFKRALALAPASAGILNNLGNHYLAAGQPGEALAAFRKVMAVEPQHQNANLQMARLLVERKQGAAALGHLARLKPPAAGSPAVELLRARALDQAGRKAEAKALFAKLESSADSPAGWYSLGLALGETGEYAPAESAFSKALEADPANPDIQHNLGLAALRAGHVERAQQVFEAMLRVNPEDPEALFQLGRTLAQAGNYDEALRPLARARALAPKRPDIVHAVATTAAQAGYFGDAGMAFDDYLKLRPDDEVARRERGFAFACAGIKHWALPDLEWYVQRHPGDAEGHFQLGFALSVNELARATRELNEALRLKPDLAEAYLTRGAIYQSEGKALQAVPDLEHAVSLRPDHVKALVLLGRAYLQLERPKDAARVLRHGYELAPEDSQVLMNYGRALLQTDQREEGQRILERLGKVGADRLARRAVPGTLGLMGLPEAEFNKRYEANLRSALKSHSGAPEVRQMLARFLLSTGRRDEAFAEYKELLAGPAEPDVLRDGGRGLLEAGEFALAKEFLARAAAADPDARVRLDLVVALLGNREPDAALGELDRVSEKDRQGDYYLLRAQVSDAQGKIDEAVRNLNLGFSKAPTRAGLYEKAVSFLLRHRMDGEALKLLEQATTLLPDEPDLLLLQATVLAIQNRASDALALLGRISSRWPEWSRAYLVRAIIEENHGNSQAALKSVETALAMGEQGAEAYYYLAQALYHAAPDSPRPALEAVRKALALDASDPWAQALAGRLAWQAGDFEASLGYLLEGIRLKKDFVQAHFWLAATYKSMGRQAESAAELAEVQRIHERNPQAEAEEAAHTRDRLFR